MRFVEARKIQLVLEVRGEFPAVLGAAAAPVRSALSEVSAATLVRPVAEVSGAASARVRSKPAATAATIWAADPTTATARRLVGKVDLDGQNVPRFNTVTLLLLEYGKKPRTSE